MREVKLTQNEHAKFIQVMEERLRERDMSLNDLAEAIGVSIQSIYNFRTDKSRNPSKFLGGKIATFLGITPLEYRR